LNKSYFVATKLSENIAETPEGYLLCLDVPIARTGEMIYGHGESPVEVGEDGKAIVSRDSRELFRKETIASFEGKPFTIKHPEDFVNPSNWRMLACGVLQNVRRGSGETESDLLADILVTDAQAISRIKGGTREVSCGYECEYIQMGIGRGIQTNIIGNHLALVEQGRAGTSYAINDQQGAKMKNLGDKIKGIFAKAGDEAAKVVDESGTKDNSKDDKSDEAAPAWAVKLEKTMSRVADGLASVAASKDEEEKKDDKKKDDKKSEDADKDDEKKDDAKDEESDKDEAKDAIESRFSKLEDAVAKLCDAAGVEYGESEDGEGDEESEDDDFEETPAASAMDEKSRIEILAPGMKTKGKDAKRSALIEASKTADTMAIIKRLNGGKAVDLKKAAQKTIDHLFVGTSEVVALYRTKDFAKLKQVRDSQGDEMDELAGEAMTPEKINEINAKHYAKSEKGVH